MKYIPNAGNETPLCNIVARVWRGEGRGNEGMKTVGRQRECDEGKEFRNGE